MRIAMLSAAEIFRRGDLEVPFFQCTYRWKRERWEEWWRILRERAALRLAGSGSSLFVGRVILDTHPATASARVRREIIDGQHRLTTLQLALAAARDVCGDCGFVPMIHDCRKDLRLRSNGADHEQFSAVILAGGPEQVARLDAHAGGGLLAGAYLYFCQEIRSWLDRVGERDRAEAALALRAAVEEDLRFFVFDLERVLPWRVIYCLFGEWIWPQRRRADRRLWSRALASR